MAKKEAILLNENQTTLFSDNPEYDAFVEKFKRKKTTDDCYTPENVYNAVADWVAEEYSLDRACFVRPFWPDSDYQTFDYPSGCVVMDNPPFSIYTRILKWYQANNIKFFLFAPALTLFVNVPGVCFISTGTTVIYENGASVRTSFATNLDSARARTAPDLHSVIYEANKKNENKKYFPKYEYPNHVVTAAIMHKLAHSGVDFRFKPEESEYTHNLDNMRKAGKGLFGGGFLLSDRAAQAWAEANAEHTERIIANMLELTASKIKNGVNGKAIAVWSLSERELEITRKLSANNATPPIMETAA